MDTERTVSPGMFALLVAQARIKTAMSQNIDIDPELLSDEINEAIIALADLEAQASNIEWLERGKRLLQAWIHIGSEHMKQVAPLTYADCLSWQSEQDQKRPGDTMNAHTPRPLTVKTSVSDKRTPGPWHIDIRTAHSKREIYGERGDLIALTDAVFTDLATAQANAAFIVRACNSYEAMLEALKHAVYHENAKWLNPQALDMALRAIAKAEWRA